MCPPKHFVGTGGFHQELCRKPDVSQNTKRLQKKANLVPALHWVLLLPRAGIESSLLTLRGLLCSSEPKSTKMWFGFHVLCPTSLGFPAP